MRDRDWYGQNQGRGSRDEEDDRWRDDENRGGRDERQMGQRYPEQSWGQRERGRGASFGGEGYRGGGYGGGGQRNYGREQTESGWRGEVRRGDYPSSFGGGYGGGSSGYGGYGREDSGYSRGYSTGFYGRQRERGSERNFGVGYGGYGEENERDERYGDRDDRGLLERAGDWIQRKLGNAPKGYKRSDERIREDVCDLIMRRPEVDASDVDVAVVEGEVTLTGTVPQRHMKRLLEDLSEDVLGVKDVHNQVKVRREGEPMTSSTAADATGMRNDRPVSKTPGSASTSSRPSS